jgi:hypothetical protein
MIVEERCYTVRPGTVARYYKDYDPRGLGIQTRILGNLIGYFHTEIGELNQIVHLWGMNRWPNASDDVRCLLPTANGKSTLSSPPTSS